MQYFDEVHNSVPKKMLLQNAIRIIKIFDKF